MQNFIDTATQQLWSFDDDVVVTENNGAYEFTAAHGAALDVPATLTPYEAPAPTAAQIAAAAAVVLANQASAALAAGLTITSESTPALNGTYTCDTLSQMDVIAIETGINAGKGFPGGVSTFNYLDIKGNPHGFTEPTFTALALAIRDYVYGLKSVAAGASNILPVASVSII